MSMEEISQIYDKVYDKAFKRILTLSDKAVINLINGLFDTDYPTNSKITYNWTEYVYKNRIFESGGERTVFPRPCVIYLNEGKKIPYQMNIP